MVEPMLFMIAGYVKPGAEDELVRLGGEFSDHIAEVTPAIAALGVLSDRDGSRKGYAALVTADSFEQAEKILRESPYFQEKVYERIEVFEYQVEVGQVG
jgi:uncharacterized protein YciI